MTNSQNRQTKSNQPKPKRSKPSKPSESAPQPTPQGAINRSGGLNQRQRRMIGATFRPFCQILVLIGVATLMLALVTIWQYRASTRRSASITGVVTEVNKVSGVGRDSDGAEAQKCRIGYKFTIDNVEYTDVLGYRGNPTADKCHLAVGQSIDIKYDTSHPANNSYRLDDSHTDHETPGQTAVSAGGIGLVGIGTMAVGLVGLAVAKRHRQEAKYGRR